MRQKKTKILFKQSKAIFIFASLCNDAKIIQIYEVIACLHASIAVLFVAAAFFRLQKSQNLSLHWKK